MRTTGLCISWAAGPTTVRVAAILICLVSGASSAEITLTGQILDINGNPVRHAFVTLTQPVGEDGSRSTTVFANSAGKFAFPTTVAESDLARSTLESQALGFQQVSPTEDPVPLVELKLKDGNVIDALMVMRGVANKAATAPPSAWLQDMPQSAAKATLLRECVSCHQFPTPEVRRYAVALNDVPGDSTAARKHAWTQMAAYMSRRMTRFFQRGMEINAAYLSFEQDDIELVSGELAERLPRRFDVVDYDYGAPLAVTGETVIREYAVSRPNAIREAVMTGALDRGDAAVWVVDTLQDRLIRIDADSGRQKDYPVPYDGASGPDMLVNGDGDTVWVGMLFGNLLGRFDAGSGEWHLERMKKPDGGPVMPHDIAFDWKREAAFDKSGRLWLSDTANNAVLGVDPGTGAAAGFAAPRVGERSNIGILMYGAVMSSDREHLWFTQLGGQFGCFNISTGKFETVVELPPGAGPRRPAITESDILYVPLFGNGQIVEYDTRARKQLAVHDLPDRASAPYAVTWDAQRQVLWVATANANAIYRFDARSKSFSVIPLPRQKALLRMLDIDPSGVLVTSYANLPDMADGPRMAVLIEPGDEVR